MTPSYIRTRAALSLSALGLLIAGGLLFAGPLNPPAGPVAPTFKTLAEVEPRIAINTTNTPGDSDSLFKITQPGSYYLTGTITGVVGKRGIEIAASGVTLDLNGFELFGVPQMGYFDGVSVTTPALKNISVVNGSIRNWGDQGVDLSPSFTVINFRLADLLDSGNVADGISAGVSGTIVNCTATGNGGAGIYAPSACTITGCSASINSYVGIRTGDSCTISNCTANNNSGGGIATLFGCTVANCSAAYNSSTGIHCNDGCVVTDCSVYNNAGAGIHLSEGGSVTDCHVTYSMLDGIFCTSRCTIRGNACANNGANGSGAGIHASVNLNRIEGNHCTAADRGIHVTLSGNVIIKNTCSQNTTNWDVAAGNVIVVVSAPLAGAVVGNSGGTATGATDPNANFTY